MPGSADFQQLTTEQPHPASRNLDSLGTPALLALMNAEDARLAACVAPALPAIEAVIAKLHSVWESGGCIIFIGAGTSGRLGVLEAAECPPTFNTPPERIQAIMAGGREAVFQSQEGAEDNREAAEREIRDRVNAGDAVVGIAASGVTPFVEAGLATARQLGAFTALIACQPAERVAGAAETAIAIPVGPELLTGSTRLKAGSATKMVLNMLTLGTMVRAGKVYGNLMVDLQPKSLKLQARARRIVSELAGITESEAATALQAAGYDVKLAVVMQRLRLEKEAAQRALAQHHGNLRRVIESRNRPA